MMPEEEKEESYMKIRSRSDCPCGSGKIYHECCRPLHIGTSRAETAEQLMRSRYSAFFFRLTDYLVDTYHPETRTKTLFHELDEMIHDIKWRKLTIHQCSKGQVGDKQGKVEFSCDYHLDGEFLTMSEHSRFRRYKGIWKYLDGKG